MTSSNLVKKFGQPEVREREVSAESLSQTEPGAIDYWQEVKPILDNRCVVCHGCYDAPCQLKLTAPEGIDRGAHKSSVYDASRIVAAKPTRLFEDENNTQAWRNNGFFPVLNEYAQSARANREASSLYQLLDLKQANPLPAQTVLDDQFTFGLYREGSFCPAPDELEQFKVEHPLWGMPYALPGLNESEHKTISTWIEQGGVFRQRSRPDAKLLKEINAWERFFNQSSTRGQLVSRYLYEHLYLANIYFQTEDTTKPASYFKLVRSSTPPGEAVNLITTRRPYDDPGVETVFYRLVPQRETIVDKTHMPYKLDVQRKKQWQTWFFDNQSAEVALPGYELPNTANPFETFKDIPANTRYRFLLDEAQFTIMNFIKGSVCRGQMAVNVIRDHFWVFFVDPDGYDESIVEEFAVENTELFELPSAKENIFMPLSNWLRYSNRQKKLLALKDATLADTFGKGSGNNITLDLIWDGDQTNPNGALTVFRNHDSATVEKGLHGDAPLTAWVFGYSLLERLHYLLVAGYDVYGNVGHQLFSRLHMDFLRMEGESNFLLLLPYEERSKQREYWYRDARDSVNDYMLNESFDKKIDPAITFTTTNPKQELFEQLKGRLGPSMENAKTGHNVKPVHLQQLATIQTFKGMNTRFLAEVSAVEITDQTSHTLGVATIIKNRGHSNVASLFGEEERLLPDENTLSVLPGMVGAYPNVVFSVEESDLKSFAQQLTSIKDDSDYSSLLDTYGVRRTNPGFWRHSDNIHAWLQQDDPIDFGMLDYNRLENR